MFLLRLRSYPLLAGIFIIIVLLLHSCGEDEPDPYPGGWNNREEQVEEIIATIDTVFYKCDVWYNTEMKVTKYRMTDSAGALIEEAIYSFTDTLVIKSVETDSSMATVYYLLNDEGLAVECVDSTWDPILHSWYFYGGDTLREKVEYPLYYEGQDSLFKTTYYYFHPEGGSIGGVSYALEFDQEHPDIYGYCHYDYDYDYRNRVSLPAVDVFYFQNGLLGRYCLVLPTEYGLWCPPTGRYDGATFVTIASYEYEKDENSFLTRLISTHDAAFSEIDHKLVAIKDFSYYPE